MSFGCCKHFYHDFHSGVADITTQYSNWARRAIAVGVGRVYTFSHHLDVLLDDVRVASLDGAQDGGDEVVHEAFAAAVDADRVVAARDALETKDLEGFRRDVAERGEHHGHEGRVEAASRLVVLAVLRRPTTFCRVFAGDGSGLNIG